LRTFENRCRASEINNHFLLHICIYIYIYIYQGHTSLSAGQSDTSRPGRNSEKVRVQIHLIYMVTINENFQNFASHGPGAADVFPLCVARHRRTPLPRFYDLFEPHLCVCVCVCVNTYRSVGRKGHRGPCVCVCVCVCVYIPECRAERTQRSVCVCVCVCVYVCMCVHTKV
jgi:hypothetical protein